MKLTLSLIGFFWMITLFSQSNSCDSIVWTKEKKLMWSDFKANADTTMNFEALSRVSINRKWTRHNDTVTIVVSCTFKPCLSWSKSKNSKTLLMHEQGHFNIAEYFKRLLVNRLMQQPFDRENFETQMNNIDLSISKEQDELDKLYDTQTDFSQKRTRQIQWSRKIILLVDTLKGYSREKIIVTLSE